MQINLLNMYNLDMLIIYAMRYKKNKQPYFPNYTPIDSAELFKPDRVQMQKMREKMEKSIVVRDCLIHTHESITLFGLQRFFITTIKILQQYYNSKPFNPTLTSLEDEAYALIYTKNRRSSPGGRKSQGDRSNQLMQSQSMQI